MRHRSLLPAVSLTPVSHIQYDISTRYMPRLAAMYELFILGKLMHRPMHGYLIQSIIINAALGPFRKLSWGTLYPLLRKLKQSGLIAVQDGKSSDQRGTKYYRTTPRGRTRFFELMRTAADPTANTVTCSASS